MKGGRDGGGLKVERKEGMKEGNKEGKKDRNKGMNKRKKDEGETDRNKEYGYFVSTYTNIQIPWWFEAHYKRVDSILY
jgi:hypothetical protein